MNAKVELWFDKKTYSKKTKIIIKIKNESDGALRRSVTKYLKVSFLLKRRNEEGCPRMAQNNRPVQEVQWGGWITMALTEAQYILDQEVQ